VECSAVGIKVDLKMLGQLQVVSNAKSMSRVLAKGERLKRERLEQHFNTSIKFEIYNVQLLIYRGKKLASQASNPILYGRLRLGALTCQPSLLTPSLACKLLIWLGLGVLLHLRFRFFKQAPHM